MAMEFELLRHLVKRPITLIYPYRKRKPARGLRGKHEIDMSKCIGCGICARDCPAFAIEMEGKGPKVEFIRIYLDRCLFCGQCEESCPRKAIKLTTDYELAEGGRGDLVLRFEK